MFTGCNDINTFQYDEKCCILTHHANELMKMFAGECILLLSTHRCDENYATDVQTWQEKKKYYFEGMSES